MAISKFREFHNSTNNSQNQLHRSITSILGQGLQVTIHSLVLCDHVGVQEGDHIDFTEVLSLHQTDYARPHSKAQ